MLIGTSIVGAKYLDKHLPLEGAHWQSRLLLAAVAIAAVAFYGAFRAMQRELAKEDTRRDQGEK